MIHSKLSRIVPVVAFVFVVAFAMLMTVPTPESESPEASSAPVASRLVDIYCAQTARDAFSDEDLEFFLDLVLYKLEPQAVELLLNSFPAFRTAADQGLIGREIGLYVYCITGDDDGVPEHANVPANAIAYVGADTAVNGDDVRYRYMIGIDVSSLAEKDGDVTVRDPVTGKLVLAREGENMIALENTIVHELFHTIMDDFNRPGMLGSGDGR